jgi:hypothetical protein
VTSSGATEVISSRYFCRKRLLPLERKISQCFPFNSLWACCSKRP